MQKKKKKQKQKKRVLVTKVLKLGSDRTVQPD